MCLLNICDLIFSVSVMVYILFTVRYIKMLKDQNKMLALLLSRTAEAANIIKYYRDCNSHSEEGATEDGDKEGNN